MRHLLKFAFLTAAVFPSPGATLKPVKFDVGPSIAAGGSPVAIAVADVNGDGIPDAVSLNSKPNPQLAVILGMGGGKFAPPVITSLSAPYTALVVGDFNQDGKLDIIAGSNASLSLFVGNGDGTFHLPQTVAQLSGTLNTLISADFNADGIPDLLVGNPEFDSETVFVGKGDGTFQQLSVLTCGHAVALADFNHDGHRDVISVCQDIAPSAPIMAFVYLGNGDGTFATGVSFSQTESSTPAVVTGDFDQDGNPDIVFLADNAAVFFGNGDGTFKTGPVYPTTADARAAIAGDFNHDGFLDVAYSFPEGVGLLRGNGAGGFSPAIVFGAGQGGAESFVSADINQDGYPDFVIATGYGTSVVVLPGDAQGGFQGPAVDSVGAHGATIGIATADFNRDGKLDVVTSSGDVLVGNGKGHFNSRAVIPSRETAAVTVVDLNNDGKSDVVFGSGLGDTSIAAVLGNGDGTFQAPLLTTLIGSSLSALAHADFNRDGKQDVVGVAVSFDNVPGAYLFLGHGDGTFAPPVTISTASLSQVITGDFNKDGKPDLLLFGVSGNSPFMGSLQLLLGNGDGTFQPAQTINPGNFYYSSIAVTDLNADGNPDVIVGGANNPSPDCSPDAILYASVMLGHGDGTFGTPTLYKLQANPQYSCIVLGLTGADFNQDGKQDIAVLTNGAVLVLLGSGSGTLQQQTNSFAVGYTVSGASGNILTFGNLNGDSFPDMLLTDNGYLWPLLNTTK